MLLLPHDRCNAITWSSIKVIGFLSHSSSRTNSLPTTELAGCSNYHKSRKDYESKGKQYTNKFCIYPSSNMNFLSLGNQSIMQELRMGRCLLYQLCLALQRRVEPESDGSLCLDFYVVTIIQWDFKCALQNPRLVWAGGTLKLIQF